MRYISLQLLCALVLTAYAAHAQNPTSADDYSQRGIARFEKNDFEGAIADFTKAIELKGQQLEFCYYFRGIALYRLGKLDDAVADLSKAITLKQHPRFYDDRGNLLAQKADFDGALADLNKAIELEPKYAKAYGDRGIVRMMRGENAAAESDFRKCFELDKRLESQFKTATSQIKQQAVLRSEHKKPSDVEVLKFSWTESPSQVLVAPSSPAIAVTTTGVSQSGLRVTGDPTAKDQAGPPPLLDPASTALPAPRGSTTAVKGVDYKFNVSVKNTGSKSIVAVQWAYSFYPKDPRDALTYVLTTKTTIPPGKEKNLTEQVPSTNSSKSQSKLPTEYNRSLFEERVVILRLDYADGTSWHSAGPLNVPQKIGQTNLRPEM
jgi:Tfp pilus assembly protein PilF